MVSVVFKVTSHLDISCCDSFVCPYVQAYLSHWPSVPAPWKFLLNELKCHVWFHVVSCIYRWIAVVRSKNRPVFYVNITQSSHTPRSHKWGIDHKKQCVSQVTGPLNNKLMHLWIQEHVYELRIQFTLLPIEFNHSRYCELQWGFKSLSVVHQVCFKCSFSIRSFDHHWRDWKK